MLFLIPLEILNQINVVIELFSNQLIPLP